jgi:hypothetical protein
MKIRKNRVLATVLALCMLVGLIAVVPGMTQEAHAESVVSLTPSETFTTVNSRDMLDAINSWRATTPNYRVDDDSQTTSTDGVDTYALQYDTNLEQIALQRAEEIVYKFDHERPNGSMCFSLTVNGTASQGENIAAFSTNGMTDAQLVETAFTMWQEANEDYSGQGHRRNMLGVGADWQSIGIAGIKSADGNIVYFVQEFSRETPSATSYSLPGTYSAPIEVIPSAITIFSFDLSIPDVSVDPGETIADADPDFSDREFSLVINGTFKIGKTFTVKPGDLEDNLTVTTEDSSIATASYDSQTGKVGVTGVGNGSTSLSFYIGELKSTKSSTIRVGNQVTSISVKTKPANTYLTGGTLDVTNGTLTVTYEDNTTSTIALTADMVSGFDTATAGEKTLTVTYKGKTATMPYLVIEKPSDMTATYGKTLADLTLPASSYGAFAWIDDATKLDNIGENTFNAKFTPNDAKYSTLEEIPVKVTVSKANPAVTNPVEANATYGQTLAKVKLPSGYAFEQDLSTPVGNAGTNTDTFTAKYTPTDTEHYNEVPHIKVTMKVSKANPAVTSPVKANATYGQTLADVKLPSGYAFEQDLSTSVGSVGTDTTSFTAQFTPTDSANYNKVTGIPVELTVGKASLSDVSIGIAAPVTGTVPAQTASSVTKGCTVTAISWDPADNPYQELKVYTVTITVEADANHDFTGAGFQVNEADATVVSNDGSKAVITYTFPKTVAHTHTMEAVEKVEPTCTEKGREAYYHCTTCNRNFKNEDGSGEIMDLTALDIEANGHSLALVEKVEPTCSEKGREEYYHCSACNKNFKDAAGSEEITDLAALDIAATPHEYSTAWVSDETGHWHVCSQCGEKSTVEAHAYSEWVHTGSHTHECAVCGYKQTEDCTFGDWKVTKVPTATEKGERERVCSKCGYVEKADIPATGTQNKTGSGTATKADTGKKTPDTGDSSSLLLWSLLLMASLGSGYAVLSRKKHKKSGK